MMPEVVFSLGSGAGGVPMEPDPSYGTSSSAPFAGWTLGASDYECGVFGIMGWVQDIGIGTNPVMNWEVFNEPDTYPPYNGALAGQCTSTPNSCGGTISPTAYLCGTDFSPCGPLEASELWQLAYLVDQVYFPTDGFQIATLTLSKAENSSYGGSYMTQTLETSVCGSGYYCADVGPGIWAVHDYDDASNGIPFAVGDITDFLSMLASNYSEGNTVWITESAVNISSVVAGDQNCNTADSDCGPSSNSDCYSLVNWPDSKGSVNYTFGGCTEADPDAQYTAASSFIWEAYASEDDETISQVDWYEFEPNNETPNWDSGLFSADTGTFASPNGLYTEPRYSACAVAGDPLADCSDSPYDASDWSSVYYSGNPEPPS
jgi:hypothetical protein